MHSTVHMVTVTLEKLQQDLYIRNYPYLQLIPNVSNNRFARNSTIIPKRRQEQKVMPQGIYRVAFAYTRCG